MNLISNSDVKPLNFIIDELLSGKDFVISNDLRDKGFIIFENDKYLESSNNEFDRFLKILNLYGCADGKISDADTGSASVAKRNSNTLQFKNNGGFEKVIKKLEFEKERERIEFEKSKIDLELAENMLKEFPKTKRNARIGITIAIILALKELYVLLMQLLSQ